MKGEEFLTVWRKYCSSVTGLTAWPSCQGADAKAEDLISIDCTEAILISVVTFTRRAASSRGGKAVRSRFRVHSARSDRCESRANVNVNEL